MLEICSNIKIDQIYLKLLLPLRQTHKFKNCKENIKLCFNKFSGEKHPWTENIHGRKTRYGRTICKKGLFKTYTVMYDNQSYYNTKWYHIQSGYTTG